MADANVVRKDFYVYVLFDPRDGSPFYVGKGQGKRIDAHLHIGNKGNARRAEVIQAARDAGLDIPRVKVAVGLTEDEAFAVEIAWITALGRVPHGVLVNRMPGGANPPSNAGRKHSAETRQKMRDTAKRIGQGPSRACIDAMIASRKGVPYTPERREKQAVHLRAIPRTPEWAAKISSSLKGRANNKAAIVALKERSIALRESRRRSCDWCGASFLPNRPLQAFCDKKCSGCFNARKRLLGGRQSESVV